MPNELGLSVYYLVHERPLSFQRDCLILSIEVQHTSHVLTHWFTLVQQDVIGSKAKIRLRGGRSKEEGRVEVKIDSNSKSTLFPLYLPGSIFCLPV